MPEARALAERSSGVLLHPSSLPGPFGIGELGGEARRFVDFLAGAGQRWWQVLPLGPTGYGDSPYQCFSAFAGNPLLISLETLSEEGLLAPSDLKNAPPFPPGEVNYGWVRDFKLPLLERAWRNFRSAASSGEREQFETFTWENAAWLDDFALFMAAKDAHGGVAWTKWDPAIAGRRPEALEAWRERLGDRMELYRYWQFEFFRQWRDLKQHARERGIRVMGDLPIYVAHDSSDVWSHRELFCLDARGEPEKVAGVPPDYFSATGQLWGNPLYRWDVLAESQYRWWIARMRAALELFDLVRLDHFRGFEAYWEIPAGEASAVNGRWVKGPGTALFQALAKDLGALPIVAENLGVITPEVEALRREFGFPGMSILQFAFGKDPQAPGFQPHNYTRDLVAYTGTHDNDTSVGWWNSTGERDSTRTPEDVRKEKAFAREYLNTDGREIHWTLIRTLMVSVANTVLFPLQDVLGLASEARMNLPSTASGNWRWRCEAGRLTGEIQERLKRLAEIYGRG